MTDELKRLRHHARAMACQIMIGHAQSLSPEQLQAFAAGFLAGMCDTLTAYADDKVAYETLQSAADLASAPLLKAADVPL